LPLGDALIGPLLAVSWVGSSLGSIPKGEAFAVSREDSLAELSLAIESGDSLWAAGSNDTGAVGPIEMVSTPSRPISSGLANPVDLGTARAPVLSSGTDYLPEQSVPLAEIPAAAPAMQMNVMSPYFGGLGRAANSGLLQALASVRLSGDGHARPGREATAPARSAVPKEQIQANYGNRSLSFEANVGQADASVQFLAHGPGYGLYLTGTEAVMVLSRAAPVGQDSILAGKAAAEFNPAAFDPARLHPGPQDFAGPALQTTAVVRMQVLGANAAPRVVGEDPLPGKVNYFLGNDPSRWHSNISTFAKVEYQQVYPAINLVYYGSGQQLEYDFVVAPGADPSVIRLGFTGADSVAIDSHGNLAVHLAEPGGVSPGMTLIQHKPTVYQEVNGKRDEVPSAFVLSTDRSPLPTEHSPLPTDQVTFTLGTYDTSRPLIIDPVLSYSTYLGGSGDGAAYSLSDVSRGIAVDPTTGDALVTGYTSSSDFPTANPWQPNLGGRANAVVARLSADGSTLIFSTYLGGSNSDGAAGIAVDPTTGDILVTGGTTSADFPTVNPLQPNLAGFGNAFVARLSPDGSSLIFSTYLGGRYADNGFSIAVDAPTGDVLITGRTGSPNFPTAYAFQPTFGGGLDNAFVARLTADGSALIFSTYLGGGNDSGNGIALDPSTGDVVVTGDTNSPNFPVANALQPTNHGGYDAFVARLRADGSALVFSTFLGGSDDDGGTGITVDPSTGDVLIAGATRSRNFPTANPLQPNNHGFDNAFVARLRADGSALVFSTYLGGTRVDYDYGIALDPTTGDALLIGETNSPDFPTANPLQANIRGFTNAFVARVSADGRAMLFSTYLGGRNYDTGYGIAIDPTTGNVIVTGQTNSPNFPTTPGAFQTQCGTDGNCNYDGTYYHSNAFISRIA